MTTKNTYSQGDTRIMFVPQQRYTTTQAQKVTAVERLTLDTAKSVKTE